MDDGASVPLSKQCELGTFLSQKSCLLILLKQVKTPVLTIHLMPGSIWSPSTPPVTPSTFASSSGDLRVPEIMRADFSVSDPWKRLFYLPQSFLRCISLRRLRKFCPTGITVIRVLYNLNFSFSLKLIAMPSIVHNCNFYLSGALVYVRS